MKRLSTYLLAAAAIIAAGCDNNIPETGTVNSAPVSEVVLDEALASGLEIDMGSTYSLPEHISYLPVDATNTAQYYSSSDKNIATVSEEGVLTGVNEGTCTITVRIGSAESEVMAVIDVTVVEPEYIAITGIAFSQQNPEFDADETIDIYDILILSSADPAENATEKVNFSSSDEEVATIDENGIITVKKLGTTDITASAAFSEGVEPATVTVKFYRWVEYERFPGDGNGITGDPDCGSAREIMGSSQTDWDLMPHNDGGWSVCKFGSVDDSGKEGEYGWKADQDRRNCYRYAMLDNRRLVDRSNNAHLNDLPTATNGTAFCWGRPGGNNNSKETSGIYFVIDMQESLIVNYFRTVHISNNGDDRGVSVTKVSHIYGSNVDPASASSSDWTEIAQQVSGFYTRSGAGTTDDPYVYPLESAKATFENNTPYRYIKFVFDKQDHCYGFYANSTDTDADRTGGTIQIAELYMGAKLYSE